MSRDDIIRMAREAGFPFNKFGLLDADELFERFAALVAAHEREECAKLCEVKRSLAATHGCAELVTECAAAIRARGTT